MKGETRFLEEGWVKNLTLHTVSKYILKLKHKGKKNMEVNLAYFFLSKGLSKPKKIQGKSQRKNMCIWLQKIKYFCVIRYYQPN